MRLTPAMNRLKIHGLPSLVNACVLISLFSTANSFVFAASRALYGMALSGRAPRFFAKTNKRGVPVYASLLTLLMGCLSYLSVSSGTVKVLNWFINVVTSAQLVTWTCIAITWLRFNKGLKSQGIDRKTFLPARDPLAPFSAWYVLIWAPAVLFFNGYYLFFPGAFDGGDFIFAYGSVFIFLAIYLGSRVYRALKKDFEICIPAREIDYTTGLKEIEALSESYPPKASRTIWDKISRALF